MTPVELNRCIMAYNRRREAQQEQHNRELYNLARLIPAMWGKHPPSYEQVWQSRKPQIAQTDEQLYATVRGLNALFGGKEV